jgi:hypothetical protein
VNRTGLIRGVTLNPASSSMKPSLKLLTVAVVGLATTLVVRAADLAGKWKTEFDSQIGVQKYVFEFKADGGKLTGKASFEHQDQKGEVELREIKVEKDAVSFVEPLKFQEQEIRVAYKGTLNGDELKLTREVGEFATEQLVAKRVKEEAPAKK